MFVWQSGCTACFNLPNDLSCTECAAVSSDDTQSYLSFSGGRAVEVLLVCLGHASVRLQVQQNSVIGTGVIQDSINISAELSGLSLESLKALHPARK